MSSIALKFTSLLVRTLSKPIALCGKFAREEVASAQADALKVQTYPQNSIKSQAKQHPKFRRTCIRFAQFLHSSEINTRIRLLGEKNLKVRPLNDARAIDTGANFLSETFIFSVAGGLILFESIRSKRKEAAKQESIVDDIAALQDEIEWLKKQLKQSQVLHGEYRLPDHVKPTIIKINSEGAEAMDAGHPSMGAGAKPPIDVSASGKQGSANSTA